MKKLVLLLVVFLNWSCTKDFVVSFEQPTDKKLDNLKLEVFIDNEKSEEINLKTSNVIPSYETKDFSVSGEGKHQLKIKVKDTVFNYNIDYPTEKYIIISSYLKQNGKIHIGILKQQRAFIFH
jgi:hypothetical protein